MDGLSVSWKDLPDSGRVRSYHRHSRQKLRLQDLVEGHGFPVGGRQQPLAVVQAPMGFELEHLAIFRNPARPAGDQRAEPRRGPAVTPVFYVDREQLPLQAPVTIHLQNNVAAQLIPVHRTVLTAEVVAHMVQESAALAGLDAVDPLVVANHSHADLVAAELAAAGFPADRMILEPVGRNTAPAAAVAALELTRMGTDPLMLLLPADHVIGDEAAFVAAVRHAAQLAAGGKLVTFGIVPTRPETGYGYIRFGDRLAEGVRSVEEFREKPDGATAEAYVASGRYLWNSGMFMFRASVFLTELEAHAPDVLAFARRALADADIDSKVVRLNGEAFTKAPSISIDYAVMERTDRGAMLPMQAGWNDLGSWEALWRVGQKDDLNNVIKGDVVLHDVKDSYLHADRRLIAAVGLKDHIIVETSDAVMISPRDRVQDVKGLVDRLKFQNREETRSHKRAYRPWGTVDLLVTGDRFQVNRITVKPGGVLSLQKHHKRAEHWTVVRGIAKVRIDDEEFLLKANQSTYIPVETRHRLENPGSEDVHLIEVQTGDYFGEDDIVRYEDIYGRVK